MGYYYYINGSITVTPEMPADELDKLGMFEDGGGSQDLYVIQAPGEETVGILPDGSIGVIGKPGSSTIYHRSQGDHVPLNDVIYMELEALGRLVARLESPKVTGALYAYGEDNGDISRYRFDDELKPVHETPTLVWPNGDEERYG